MVKPVLCGIGVVYEYMAAVLCDVLHCQRDPLALCLTLQHYDKELNTSDASSPPHTSVITFYHYYSQWIPKHTQETLVSPSHLQCAADAWAPIVIVSCHLLFLLQLIELDIEKLLNLAYR